MLLFRALHQVDFLVTPKVEKEVLHPDCRVKLKYQRQLSLSSQGTLKFKCEKPKESISY